MSGASHTGADMVFYTCTSISLKMECTGVGGGVSVGLGAREQCYQATQNSAKWQADVPRALCCNQITTQSSPVGNGPRTRRGGGGGRYIWPKFEKMYRLRVINSQPVHFSNFLGGATGVRSQTSDRRRGLALPKGLPGPRSIRPWAFQAVVSCRGQLAAKRFWGTLGRTGGRMGRSAPGKLHIAPPPPTIPLKSLRNSSDIHAPTCYTPR